MNKLNSLVRVHKDPLPTDALTVVVYKIECSNCDASYVSQTGRRLRTRIKEHMNQINRNADLSVVSLRRLKCDHDFNWYNVKILDYDPGIDKRCISEIVLIKRQKNSINLKSDTDNLNNNYASILEIFLCFDLFCFPFIFASISTFKNCIYFCVCFDSL